MGDVIFVLIMGVIFFVVLPFFIYENLHDGSLYHKRWRYLCGREKEKTAVRVSFQNFKTYYDLSPQDYHDLDSDVPEETFGRIGYRKTADSSYHCLEVYKYEHHLVFQSFLDYLEYVRFLRERQQEMERVIEERNQSESIKNTASYYQAVINDINRLKDQAESEKKLAADTTERFAGGLSVGELKKEGRHE